MNTRNTLTFRIVTGLFLLAMLPGALMNLIQPDVAVEMAGTLGIPLALLTLIGLWKLLGIAALALPAGKRFREWAYAGFFFDLSGATFLHVAAGDYNIVGPVLFGGLLLASYRLKPRAA
jgi:hypothetical protein